MEPESTYYSVSHFTDEDIAVSRGWVVCPRSRAACYTWARLGRGFKNLPLKMPFLRAWRLVVPSMLVLQTHLRARNCWELWIPGILTSNSLPKVLVLAPSCIGFIWCFKKIPVPGPQPSPGISRSLWDNLVIAIFKSALQVIIRALKKNHTLKPPAPELVKYVWHKKKPQLCKP